MKTAWILRTMLAVLILLVVNLAWGATYKVVSIFRGSTPGGLVFDSAGNLYGTTYDGGAYGFGSVYELSPTSYGFKRTVLYSFTGGTDGREPSQYEKLVFDTHGSLYGTTITGGKYALGNIFKLTPQSGGGWKERVIHSFHGTPAAFPESGVVFDSAGNLYGTTYGGYTCRASCVGTAFELSPTSGGGWHIHILHRFGLRKNDGLDPVSALAFDPAGNLYGTTYGGGMPGCGSGGGGCGTVFRFTPVSGGGWHYNLIHRFKGHADGDHPYANVVSDGAGNIYGTTAFGGKKGLNCGNGPRDYCGTVFKLSPNSNGTWTNTVIHKFASYPTDGALPMDGVTLDQAGHVFGTTSLAGSSERGTVFELTKQSSGWQETVLYNFMDQRGGTYPIGGLVLDSAGNLYGSNLSGVVFEVTP